MRYKKKNSNNNKQLNLNSCFNRILINFYSSNDDNLKMALLFRYGKFLLSTPVHSLKIPAKCKMEPLKCFIDNLDLDRLECHCTLVTRDVITFGC